MKPMSNSATTEAPPRLAFTPGEPAGIGPDLAIALACAPPDDSIVVAYADPALLHERARLLGRDVQFVLLDRPSAAKPVDVGVLQVMPVQLSAPAVAGRLDPRNGPYVLACLDAAADACVAGELDGMVTGPVQKSVINDAGIPFTGHTEYLAERVGAPLPVMMLTTGPLRVALVTTHVALRAVPDLITPERLTATSEILFAELRTRFGIPRPRVAVCGLNPHAGEAGHLGREDEDVVRPTVAALRARGFDAEGPVPADTVFATDQRGGFDAILAMYHDQGLAALKAVGFGDSINVTLGLSIIRTSVDHGTALALAGSGRAASGSLRAALELARDLAMNGRHRARA